MSDMQKIVYTSSNAKEDHYDEFLASIKTHSFEFVGLTLFRTNARGLFEIFLNALPVHARQHYNCSACHMFVSRYGGVVSIKEDYSIEPVMWPEKTVAFFQDAVDAVRDHIKKECHIVNVFTPHDSILGIPQCNGFNHMAVQFTGKYEARREYRSDYETLWRAINEFSKETIDAGVVFANSGALFRSKEVILPILRNFKMLKDSLDAVVIGGRDTKRNIMWKYIANSKTSDCHIKSGMVGTLLEDIQNGLDSDSITAKFNAKMDPLAYMRPQAKPSTGNIQVAEKLFAELGISEESLKRRFATVDDLQTIWKPKTKEVKEEKADGIFGRLTTKDTVPAPVTPSVNRGKMTWKKFESEILPHANLIDIKVNRPLPSSISTFTTAAFPDAKPILRNDKSDKRNPVTKYLRKDANMMTYYNIKMNMASAVTAICYDPDVWNNEVTDKSTIGINFIIDGAKDISIAGSSKATGTAIFPEDLIPELREVRSVIAEYSNTDIMLGQDEASATGVRIQNGLDYGDFVTFTVYTDDMGIIMCTIDRFE